MRTANQHQIAVLLSQPAVIGRLFLTVEEAAQRLGVTAGWIYERTRRKAIPHRKLGKFVRFTEEDLRAIVEAAAKGKHVMSQGGHIVKPTGKQKTWAIIYRDPEGTEQWEGKFKEA